MDLMDSAIRRKRMLLTLCSHLVRYEALLLLLLSLVYHPKETLAASQLTVESLPPVKTLLIYLSQEE